MRLFIRFFFTNCVKSLDISLSQRQITPNQATHNVSEKDNNTIFKLNIKITCFKQSMVFLMKDLPYLQLQKTYSKNR